MGAEAVSGTALRPGGNEWRPGHPCKHQPGAGPLSIIRLYSYRFRIECTFRELKQQIGAFCYHFWSKYMPKLSYYQKKGEPTPMERVEGEKPRQKCWKPFVPLRCTWHCPVLQWEFCRAFLSALLGRLVLARSVTRGHLPKEGFRKPPLCTTSENIFFSAFWRKTRIIHNANNSEATGKVRRTMGFSGFLVVQTFNCQGL